MSQPLSPISDLAFLQHCVGSITMKNLIYALFGIFFVEKNPPVIWGSTSPETWQR